MSVCACWFSPGTLETVNGIFRLSGSEPSAEPTLSDSFDFVAGNSNRHCALNQVDGNHQAEVGIHAHQNSLHSVEGTAADANPLVDAQKRVARHRHLVMENGLNILDLFVGDRRTATVVSDEAGYSGGAQHGNPGFRRRQRADEHIPWKQRHFDLLVPIAPAV